MEKIKLGFEREEEIIDTMYSLISDAYEERISKVSIRKNYNLWCENKKNIYDAFSRSPLWNERELCIVSPVTLNRRINLNLVVCLLRLYKSNHQIMKDVWKVALVDAMYYLFKEINTSEFTGKVLESEINRVDSWYDSYKLTNMSYTNEELLNRIESKEIMGDSRINFGLIYGLFIKYKVRVGQKWSKVFNKIFVGEELNVGKTDLYELKENEYIKGVRDYASKDTTNWYIDYYYNYDQLYAVISDVLTPYTYNENVYISINPIDYLTQSHGDNWHSCHSLENKGQYHGATLTMMVDKTSVIAYTLPKDVDKDYCLERKKTRQSLFIGNNLNSIFQNSFYPNKDMQISKFVREVIEPLLANYKGLNNIWKSYNSLDDIYSDDYLGYEDWNYQYHACYHLKESNEPYDIEIGRNAYSIDDSSEYVCSNESLLFSDDECCNCGYRCDLTYLEYYDAYVCADCLDEHYAWCEDIDAYRTLNDAVYLDDKDYYVSKDYPYYCCPECGGVYSMDEEYKEVVTKDGKISVCVQCLVPGKYFYCDECDEWYRIDAIIEEEDKKLCPNCSKNLVVVEE